jgi:hypothetical protein
MFYFMMIFGTALGFIGHSYRSFAHRFDWPTGAMFYDTFGFARLSAILIAVMPLIVWERYGALQAISVLLLGSAAGGAAIMLLGYRAQHLWAIGMVVLIALGVWNVIA